MISSNSDYPQKSYNTIAGVEQTKSNNKAQVRTLRKVVECQYSPVGLFSRLSEPNNNHNRILLESSEINSKAHLKSIIVNRAALRIECNQQTVQISALTANGLNALKSLKEFFSADVQVSLLINNQLTLNYPATNHQHQALDEESRLKRLTPVDSLRKIHSAFERENESQYSIFLAGLFSFDLIASFEQLPDVKTGENSCPDFVFYLAEEVIVFDHQTHRSTLYSNIFSGVDEQKNYFEQSRRMQFIADSMMKENSTHPSIRSSNNSKQKLSSEVNFDISDQEYEQSVETLKQEIIAGNVFQVVPSRTFSLDCANRLLSYQKLKDTNPSPYMFYLDDQDFTLFGASPESALKYTQQSRQVELYPIAGTRPRGKHASGVIDHDLDKRLETELKLDQKEISEHMMLVDLARNDIARISQSSSVRIPRLLEIDRYSQVMHLVSCVQGILRKDLDCLHAYQACMNMGTLTGAPKIKASEIIRHTEKKRRGSYGGAVGYINSNGDMDSCIVIRSAFCKNHKAYIQAGAGIVYDSIPQSEAEETRNKANAVILAIQLANQQIANSNSKPEADSE
jgi:anthranilate synthase component I